MNDQGMLDFLRRAQLAGFIQYETGWGFKNGRVWHSIVIRPRMRKKDGSLAKRFDYGYSKGDWHVTSVLSEAVQSVRRRFPEFEG